MRKAFYMILTACFFMATALAQNTSTKKFKMFHGNPGIVKKVSELRAASARSSAAERPDSLKVLPLKFRLDEARKFRYRIGTQGLKEGYDFEREGPDDEGEEGKQAAAAQSAVTAATGNTTTLDVWSNFLGTTYTEYPGGWPPDPNGSVGSSQVVTLTNGSLKVYEKRAVTDPPLTSSKALLHTPAKAQFAISLDEFFAPVRTSESLFVSDPHVRYDRLTKRWYVVCIDVNQSFANNSVFLAVSTGDQITDASSFSYYSFPSAIVPYDSSELNAPFLDYPTLGIDDNSILIGGNQFFYDSLYFVGYAINKKELLQGYLSGYALKLGVYDPSKNIIYGPYTPQGVHNDNPSSNKSYFAGTSIFNDGLNIATLTYDTNGFLTDLNTTFVHTDPYQFPRGVTALGSPMPIDPLDTRLFAAAIHKNKITGKSSLWTAHAIGVNQWGSYVADSVFVQQARTGSRWYEIDHLSTTPHLSQAGTLYDDQPASGRRAISYFNPSIATSGQGRTVLGGTTAAYNRHLNAFVAGRTYNDAVGTLGTPQKVTATSGLYAPFQFGTFAFYISRWGDYSQSEVDPEDDQTLWTFQEYCNADDDYGLRATQIKAPPPATPLPPDAISNQNNVWVTVKGVSVDNSGFFDPGSDKGGPGYKRLSVKATGNGLIASSVKFVSPTEIRFWLNAKGKPAGTYTLVITNPDGQIVTTDLTIVAEMLTAAAANSLVQQEVEKYSTSSAVTPNPTLGSFQLQITAAQAWTARVVLMDVSGKKLGESKHSLAKGLNQIALSVAAYDKGTYLAAVYNQNNVLIAVQKVVKQ